MKDGPKGRCRNGHLRTAANSYTYQRNGKPYTTCRICKQNQMRSAMRQSRVKTEAGDFAIAERILELHEEKEVAPTWWMKQEIQEEIDALQAQR